MSEAEYSVRDGWKPRYRPETIDKIAAGLVAVQSEVLLARKDSNNPFHKSKYADLGSVWDAVREPLRKNGLSIMQLPSEAPAGYVGLVTIVLHESGQSISEKFFMPVKDDKNPQAVGSALTYARRYALSAALGVCPEDDDGEAARKPAERSSVVVGTPVSHQDPGVRMSDAERRFKQQLRAEFEAAKTELEQKQVYTKTRNSTLQEPAKSELLKSMADTIKGNKES